jgi:hypothetical protein
MNNDALAKVTMIKGSLRCFAYGLLGLLPGIGIPFAVAALWNAGRVRGYEKKYWNAAGQYRSWGVICAAFGLIFWFVVIALITYNAAASDDGTGGFNSLYGDGGGGD